MSDVAKGPRLSSERRAELKADILRGTFTARELAEAYGLHPNSIRGMAARLGIALLSDVRGGGDEEAKEAEEAPGEDAEAEDADERDQAIAYYEQRVAELHELIVDLTLENQRLRRATEAA